VLGEPVVALATACLFADFAAVARGVDVRHLTHEGRLEDLARKG
jgi:hypothetical protein